MKVFYSFVFFCIICLCSCKQNVANKNDNNTDSVATMKMATDTNNVIASVDSTQPAKNTPEWVGTYKRIESGGAVDTEIMLYEDSTYMYTAKYHGTEQKEVKLEGSFIWTIDNHIELKNAKGEPAGYVIYKDGMARIGNDPRSSTIYALSKEK